MIIPVRLGPDPFGRGNPTVFYRDTEVGDGQEVFYCWLEHWHGPPVRTEADPATGGVKYGPLCPASHGVANG